MQDELTLLLAKRGGVPRGLAFQAARRLGLQEFEWMDPNTGRVGRFHTRMAGEGMKLPRGMKESDLYRDPAQERSNRNYYDATQQAERDYQQELRNISSESDTQRKNDIRSLTSGMAPFEQNQQALRDLDRHMAQMQDYELNELIQGTVNEEVEKTAAKDRAEMDRLNKEIAFYDSMVRMQDYEQAERDADTKLNLERLAPLRQQQALQPVYPELGLPGLPKALRGIFSLIDRLRAPKEPPPARQEPYFAAGGIASLNRKVRP